MSRKKSISNIIGALLFILALTIVISITIIILTEYSKFVDTVRYTESLEQERDIEKLHLSGAITDGTLNLVIANIGPITVNIIDILIHDLENNTLLSLSNITKTDINKVLNPGEEASYNIQLNSNNIIISNSTVIIVVTSRGRSFTLLIESGEAMP